MGRRASNRQSVGYSQSGRGQRSSRAFEADGAVKTITAIPASTGDKVYEVTDRAGGSMLGYLRAQLRELKEHRAMDREPRHRGAGGLSEWLKTLLVVLALAAFIVWLIFLPGNGS
jgi:hypothetical protein